MKKIIFVILILLALSCTNNKEKRFFEFEYHKATNLFDEEKYEASKKILQDLFNSFSYRINQSTTYTYAYFIMGYIYEKKYLGSNYDITIGELAILNYKTYLGLNKHKKYRYRAFEGIARIYYFINPTKKFNLIEYNLKKSILENDANSSSYRLYGNLLLYNKQYNNAILKYKNAIKFNPNNEWNYVGLGMAYSRLNNIKEAIKNYDKALIINPNNEVAQKNKLSNLIELGLSMKSKKGAK